MPKFESIRTGVAKLRDATNGYFIHKGIILPAAICERLAGSIADCLDCDVSLILPSIAYLKDVKFTEESAHDLYWRLVANKALLGSGRPVLPYNKVAFSGREECRIESVTLNKAKKYKTRVRVLTGHYAPGLLTFEFSTKGAGMIMTQAGYHGRKYPPGDPLNCLPGVYILAELEEPAANPKIFSRIINSQDMQAYNRKNILSYRYGNKSCPFKLYDCTKCPHTRVECEAALKEK